ncbi:hypothetical protein NDI85_08455 [Halomicroarcula sp. S1AR25-4]|uniref:hypothetical protein n=1 Tax=Haloarcula sp. S1AR25-4 TaxID=2950538 RepID=UPI0028762A7D|nr:hypothetical protein [Halomicroarcula sp. S1AR25-4]MDS0277824.1 hypothetical protein [Halomicroarcula sp. S1AR25-4]
MALDVSVPDPPSLHGPQPRGEYQAINDPEEEVEDDYRREEVERILADGAWHDAFEEWTTQTGLTAADFEVVVEHDLVEAFDFYWDPATDEVGYRAPALPDEARGELDAEDVDEIESELDALGRVVSEMLENDYLLRDDETFGFFDDDAPEETFDYDDREQSGDSP